MLFGQSIFESVLERLKSEEDAAAEAEASAVHRLHGLNTGFATTVMEGVSVASQRVDQAYFDNLDFDRSAEPEAPPPPEPEPVMPDHLARIAPEEIAAELAIAAEDTIQSLSEKRRAFAKANHPDRVAPAFRENATIRMKIANLLIDEAVRRLSR